MVDGEGGVDTQREKLLSASQQRGQESCMWTVRVFVLIQNSVSQMEAIFFFSQVKRWFIIYKIILLFLGMYIVGVSLGTACALYHFLGHHLRLLLKNGVWISWLF